MTTNLALPPGFVLIVAGLILPALPLRARQAVLLIAPVLALALVWLVPDGPALSVPFLGFDLVLCNGTAAGRLFGTVFSIMAFGGALYALNQKSLLELVAAFCYAGSALGVAFAGDLITVFIFWELMAIASTLVVWSAGRPAAGAGMRYASIHLLGGVLLMAGIAGHIVATGSTAFTAMHTDSVAHWLMIAGFLVNTGAPPVSAWLPDAYPRASYSGTVFLSAFTTKTAVYVLLVGFPGAEVLIFVGLYMVFYGIIYGILENDIRRILSYSLVNQVGFMVTAIGVGTPMALNGAAAHAFTHIIYKALLLMSAGSVMTMTGRSKCSELGGLFRAMPVTAITGIIGGLSISAVPLTSGFVSKAMIAEGAAEAHMPIVWLLVSAAAVGVFIDIGLKWPWYIFFAKDSGLKPHDPPLPMRAGMALFAFLCIAIGIFPGTLYRMLPFPVDYVPYTAAHVATMLQLLLAGGFAFVLVLPLLKRTATVTLDTDWLWRAGGRVLALRLADGWSRAREALMERVQRGAARVFRTIYRHYGPAGTLAKSWPTGSMAFWATLLLAAYLVLYYFG
jgi:multicomponent Na+:H+ antiporter subunit D